MFQLKMLIEAVSTFKVDLYNRLDCLSDTTIIYDSEKHEMQISAVTGNFKVQIRQNTSAKIKIMVYPDLIIQKSIPLSSVTQLSDIFANLIINCDIDFDGTEQRICFRIIQKFTENISNKAELLLSLPAIIPDGSAVYSRESEFQLFTLIYISIISISSSFLNYFDCFTSNQQAVVFTNIIRLTYELNTSVRKLCIAIYLLNNSQETVITRFAQFESQILMEHSLNSIHLQVTNVWLECIFDILGEKQCLDNIKTFQKKKSPQGIISREFFKGDILVKEVQNTLFVRNAHYSSSSVSLNQSHVCFTTSNNGEENEFKQIQIDFMIGEPRLQPAQHTNILTLRGQILYPGTQNIVNSFGTYCFQIQLNLDQKQFYNMMINNQSKVTGIVNLLSDIPVDKISIQPVIYQIDYMYVLSAVLVLSSVVWYFLNEKERK
ncbi:Hypothetical_protein [Hexamita inflata]|uniref:Hypothetical_protein n=1 Tax=Hexamita inflata TaxID=28002 RepID=A0ABP1GZK5_9EUKA